MQIKWASMATLLATEPTSGWQINRREALPKLACAQQQQQHSRRRSHTIISANLHCDVIKRWGASRISASCISEPNSHIGCMVQGWALQNKCNSNFNSIHRLWIKATYLAVLLNSNIGRSNPIQFSSSKNNCKSQLCLVHLKFCFSRHNTVDQHYDLWHYI